MDGGNSTGLAYDCDVKLMPRRTLASVLIVTTRPTNWPPTPAEPAAPSVTDVPSAWLFHPGVLANFAQFRYSKPPATLADNPRPEEVPLLPTGENDLTGVLPTRKRHPA